MFYQVYHLKDPGNADTSNLLPQVQALPFGERGSQLFGIFQGLLGLASNELYLVTFSTTRPAVLKETVAQLNCLNAIKLEPTVRPTEHVQRTEPGVYVFRWFTVHNRDVDEIASLSQAAWPTFERGFEARPQGLFAEPDRPTDIGTMLLITWYSGLTAWEDSRAPPEEARLNFRRRHKLTLEARPVATRLVI